MSVADSCWMNGIGELRDVAEYLTWSRHWTITYECSGSDPLNHTVTQLQSDQALKTETKFLLTQLDSACWKFLSVLIYWWGWHSLTISCISFIGNKQNNVFFDDFIKSTYLWPTNSPSECVVLHSNDRIIGEVEFPENIRIKMLPSEDSPQPSVTSQLETEASFLINIIFASCCWFKVRTAVHIFNFTQWSYIGW